MNLMRQRLHRHSEPRSGSNSCLRNRNDESPRNLWRFSDADQRLKWRETKLPREKTSSAFEQSDCPKPSSGARCLAGMNGEFSFPGPESGEDSLLSIPEQHCGAGPPPGEGAIATDVGIQDILQCATRDYRHRTGAEDSQTPVRTSGPMAVGPRGDLASRHGSIGRIAVAHSWPYRSDNPVCTRTPVSQDSCESTEWGPRSDIGGAGSVRGNLSVSPRTA